MKPKKTEPSRKCLTGQARNARLVEILEAGIAQMRPGETLEECYRRDCAERGVTPEER